MFLHLGSPPKGPPPPFEAWSVRQLKVLDRAIALAWGRSMALPLGRALLASGTEVQITAMLQDALTALLNSGTLPGFSTSLYGPPIRGQEMEDYSGVRLEKRPDLTISRLSARPVMNHNAMFYECKILGRGRTIDHYIAQGVARFEKGQYAWAMRHAGMIGYLVTDSNQDARSALVERWMHPTSPASCVPLAEVQEDGSAPLTIAISTHARNFVLRNGELPGPIALRHLWLGEKLAVVPPKKESV
ncbi:hypothetical protein [Fulvimonas yonginensis]|jgi:hypothetical protein|uniref:Restriction endonuclease n=1 Tax=Fulvimonas yonginensis TaxID=1495200 RepID=A0ABU8J976_9GAMM